MLDIAYLDEDTLSWAEAGLDTGEKVVHRDCNGTVLAAGDTVTLIKDLPVKGAGFTAKRARQFARFRWWRTIPVTWKARSRASGSSFCASS